MSERNGLTDWIPATRIDAPEFSIGLDRACAPALCAPATGPFEPTLETSRDLTCGSCRAPGRLLVSLAPYTDYFCADCLRKAAEMIEAAEGKLP